MQEVLLLYYNQELTLDEALEEMKERCDEAILDAR